MKYDLSILIPARNEMFLGKTIGDILANIEGDTEIIAVFDGSWPTEPIPQHPRVTIIYHFESIGQRAATNEAAKLSDAKYIMKCDAHCAFDKGFDVKMMNDMHDDWTMAPIMKNLHAFDWVCPEGHRRYQGPSGVCTVCGKETKMDVVWIAKNSPNSTSYRFDKTLHFQYFGEYAKRPEAQETISETMSLQGSCFMMTRKQYWRLNVCDEAFGSWGQQGVEVAVKTWLAGGRVMVNKNTWYAHMFRTQGGDFGFPYPLRGSEVEKARKYSRDLFLNDKWPLAIHPLSWLIKKFSPVPDWDEIPEPTKGVVYYTANQVDENIMSKCQKQLKKAFKGKIISVSHKPIDLGKNIVLPLEYSYISMFKKILAGLEAIDTDIVFFCEDDVLYSPTHFDFIPPSRVLYYYNQNIWQVRYEDGHALYYDCNKVSGLCAYRELLIEHYRERIRRIEKEGFTMRNGFEPGTKKIKHGGYDDIGAGTWRSEQPNIDIRHGKNLTKSRWSKDQFRNQNSCRNWREAEEISQWGKFSKIMEEI